MNVSICTIVEYTFEFEPQEIAHLGLDSEIEEYMKSEALRYLEPESLDFDEARFRYLMPDEGDNRALLVISF